MRFFAIILAICIVKIISYRIYAEDLSLHADSAILVDAYSGRVLYEYFADKPYIPASLTKIVSLSLAYQAIVEGRLSRDTAIKVSERASMHNLPYRSSRMSIEPGQNLNLHDLMLGMAIASGNDAAIALAETVSKDVESFVEEMNALMQKLGSTVSYFVDPAGIMDGNVITAREYARLASYYVTHYPFALEELHSVQSFSYPNLEQMNQRGTMRYTVRHNNSNKLIGNYEGVDGLKTGYLDESGYNLVATMMKDGMRLVAVILGVQAPGTQTGSKRREEDAKNLFDYAISHYRYRPIYEHDDYTDLYKHTIIGGIKSSVLLDVDESHTIVDYPMRDNEWKESTIFWHVNLLKAPIMKGQEVGYLNITSGSHTWRLPVVAKESVNRLPFWLYVNDVVDNIVFSWFRKI